MKNDPHYKYEPLNRNISSVTQLLSQIEGDKNITHRSHATDFVSLIILLPPPPPIAPLHSFSRHQLRDPQPGYGVLQANAW